MRLLALGILFALAILTSVSFAATNPCSDGTAYFKCSAKSPGMVCGPNGLEPYVKLCPCTSYPGYVQQGEGDTATCVLAKCDDGTASGQCSSTKPKVCMGGSSYADNATKCGCPAGKQIAPDGIFCKSIPCTDQGAKVEEGQCSPKNDGKMCVNGALVDKASACPCKPGQTAVNDKCTILCSDGTEENKCASTKPKKCVNGYLVDRAGDCGCPSGQAAVGNQCTTSILGGGGTDLLGGGSTSGNGTGGDSGTSSPSPCSCCLPTALIGLAGGYVFFRRKE